MVSLAVVLGLAGCSEAPIGFDEMDAQVVAQLQEGELADTGASETGPVELSGGFKPAVRAAVDRNAGYQAAVAFEKEAAASIGVASSARRPQVGGNGTIGSVYEGDPIDETTTGVAGGVTLSQLVFDGGGADAAVTRATAQAVAARAERLDRANLVALDASRAWIDVWQYQMRLSWLTTKTAKMENLVSQIERMASNGMLDRASLDSAKRQIVDIELQRSTLKAELADARIRFQRFFGREAARLEAPETVFSTSMARSHANAWKTAPALRRSAAELAAARGAAAEAEAAFKPKVSLQAAAISPLDTDDTTNVNAGLRVDYTFGDGGRRKAALEAARARVSALEEQLEEEQQVAKARMDAAIEKLATIEASMPLVARKIELSASEAETARSQIATGQSNLRQLVEAEIENYRARDQHIQMLAQQHMLLLEIAAGAGLLTGIIGLEDV
jgi:outer membrane protein TolC